jgi:hypothetical protein
MHVAQNSFALAFLELFGGPRLAHRRAQVHQPHVKLNGGVRRQRGVALAHGGTASRAKRKPRLAPNHARLAFS